MQLGTLNLAAGGVARSVLRAIGANENTSRKWERCLNYEGQYETHDVNGTISELNS